jgi:hypothetical protein
VVLVGQLSQQIGSGVNPMALGGCARNAEQICRFIDRKTAKKSELYKFRFFWLQLCEPGQSFVESD